MKAKIMNFFSALLTIDGLFRLFQIIAIAAGVLAVLALLGKDVTSRIIAERSGRELLALQKEVADARAKQADAERRLLEVQNRVAWRVVTFDRASFGDVINRGPKGKAEIVFLKDDDEAFALAMDLWDQLALRGWNAPGPVAGTSPGEGSFSFRESGTVITGQPGLAIIVDHVVGKPYMEDTPEGTLLKAFEVSGLSTFQATPPKGSTARPPAGTIRIAVGSRF